MIYLKKCLRSGQALVIVLMVCLIIGMFSVSLFTFQRGQVNLLSKSAADYLSLSVAEAGMHCVLSEMKADYQFVTHGNPYIPPKSLDSWPSPATRKYSHVKSDGIRIHDKQRGVYSGSIQYKTMKAKGEFKTRIKLIGAKNNAETKTVDEAHRYFLLESYGRVDNSCRKISAVIEKISPASFLLYDGKVLDVGGLGPYRATPGELKCGRLYGHEMINFSHRGRTDRGAELLEVEKISTPGFIKADSVFSLETYKNKKGTIKSGNDSDDYARFESFGDKEGFTQVNGFVLDGNHGAKPQKLPMLNPSYYFKAKKPKPTILSNGSSFEGFKESWWRNPYKPNEVVYDLFFGWEYEKKDDKVLLYSKVPLRIWGCPKWKAITIFCEKDVYIAGDFNANPESSQIYTKGYKDYTKAPRNGTDKNGAMILSMGRIWFDYSNPMYFLRNEMETAVDYEICRTFARKNLAEAILKPTAYPTRGSSGTGTRLPMTMLNFRTVNTLFNLPKTTPEIVAANTPLIPFHPAMKKLRDYLSDGEDEKNASDTSSIPQSMEENNTGTGAETEEDPSEEEKQDIHFLIKSAMTRSGVYEMLGVSAYTTGTVLPVLRDKAVNMILDRAEKDINEEEPDKTAGPWQIGTRMFWYALRLKGGFRMPEMTVNALLIDSANLNNSWKYGNGTLKVRNELGNVENKHMRSFPWIADDCRFIIRHYGSMIHLRNRPTKTRVNGTYRHDQPVLRRQVYDKTYVASGDYFPPYPMAGFTVISWKDTACSLKEFEEVK